jgi:hypothetical protein
MCNKRKVKITAKINDISSILSDLGQEEIDLTMTFNAEVPETSKTYKYLSCNEKIIDWKFDNETSWNQVKTGLINYLINCITTNMKINIGVFYESVIICLWKMQINDLEIGIEEFKKCERLATESDYKYLYDYIGQQGLPNDITAFKNSIDALLEKVHEKWKMNKQPDIINFYRELKK